MIPQRNISLLSNRLAAGAGLRIREDVLERDYCLAWFLNVLAESDLRTALAFKGGTALKRCYFADYRFSEDLDFTLREALPFIEIRARLEPVYAAVQQQSGIIFAFDRQDPRLRANTHTFYLRYTGPLPGSNDVKVDITINEVLSFPLANRPVLRGYTEFADLPENRTILAYSLDEIAPRKQSHSPIQPETNLGISTISGISRSTRRCSSITSFPRFAKNWNFVKNRAKICKPRSREKRPVFERCGTLACPIK